MQAGLTDSAAASRRVSSETLPHPLSCDTSAPVTPHVPGLGMSMAGPFSFPQAGAAAVHCHPGRPSAATRDSSFDLWRSHRLNSQTGYFEPLAEEADQGATEELLTGTVVMTEVIAPMSDILNPLDGPPETSPILNGTDSACVISLGPKKSEEEVNSTSYTHVPPTAAQTLAPSAFQLSTEVGSHY